MQRPIKYAEKGLAVTANGLWHVFTAANSIRRNPSFTPRWSEKPLLQVVAEDQAAAGLAARDRLALPDLRP